MFIKALTYLLTYLARRQEKGC